MRSEHGQTFSDSRARHPTAVASWARKPDARTSVCRILRHGGYVESDEAEHRWSIKIRTYGRIKYDSQSREANRGRLGPKAAVRFPGVKDSERGRSYTVFANRVTAGGRDLHRRDLHAGFRLAVRMVLAHRTVA